MSRDSTHLHPMDTKLVFRRRFPRVESFGDQALLLYDRRLLQVSKETKKWIQSFPLSLALDSGEKTKSLENLPTLMEKILQITREISSREMKIVVLGGGSLTDLGGFIASILKRGVSLILIPSTWLAAIDSAHGGKNALNVKGFKNQVGTFHFAERVELIEELLLTQPEARAREAMGEILKMCLLSECSDFQKIENSLNLKERELFKLLPVLIRSKLEIVEKDPFENSGLRKSLNLGHTLGHAFESYHQIPHGEAVLYGVAFALLWSRWRKTCSAKEFLRITAWPVWNWSFQSERYFELLKIPRGELKWALSLDKKKNSEGKIAEPFIYSAGDIRLESVSLEEMMLEFYRQKN